MNVGSPEIVDLIVLDVATDTIVAPLECKSCGGRFGGVAVSISEGIYL